MYNPKIVIAIPSHGDRTQWIKRTIENVVDDPRVEGIYIRDDGSDIEVETKLSELELMHQNVFVRLEEKTGSSFLAKHRLMNLIQGDKEEDFLHWAVLLDSDNVITKEYLHAAYAELWGDMTVYCPVAAGPFSYEKLSGAVINKSNVAGLLRSEARNDAVMLLNTMNYIINVETYCKFIKDEGIDPAAADGIYVNRIMMENGVSLKVVPGMKYEHTVHPGSTWIAKAAQSKIVSDEQIRIMESW